MNRVENPDVIVEHLLSACERCGETLEEAEVARTASRQVFDTPDPTLRVTDHRVRTLRCACGCETTASWPAEATGPVCWGPNVRAIAVYLLCVQQLPYERCAQTLADVLDAAVSTGTLADLVLEAAGCLEAFDRVVRALSALAVVAHVDETTCRVVEDSGGGTADETAAGTTRTERRRQRRQRRLDAARRGARRKRIRQKRYVHVAASPLLTWFGLHKGQGSKAMAELGVIPILTGTLVHDRYTEYLPFDNVTHAACGAHLLRNLASVADVAGQADWADGMIDVLCDLHDATEAACAGHPDDARGPPQLAPDVLADFERRYQHVIDIGYQANPEPDNRKRDQLERESFNLVVRLDTRRDEALRFAHDRNVPFTNNSAERPLRPVKLHDRISGTFRSITHADAWLRIRSYTATPDKNGIHVPTAAQ